MRSEDTERDALQVSRDGERPLPVSRREGDGPPKGNRNAFKHGFYSAEIVANRRKVGELLRAARKLVRAERES
jgi:hypothetical protein